MQAQLCISASVSVLSILQMNTDNDIYGILPSTIPTHDALFCSIIFSIQVGRQRAGVRKMRRRGKGLACIRLKGNLVAISTDITNL